jgi:hypothetical protein
MPPRRRVDSRQCDPIALARWFRCGGKCDRWTVLEGALGLPGRQRAPRRHYLLATPLPRLPLGVARLGLGGSGRRRGSPQ